MNRRAIEVPAMGGAGLMALAPLLVGTAVGMLARKRPLEALGHQKTEIVALKSHFLEESRDERAGISS